MLPPVVFFDIMPAESTRLEVQIDSDAKKAATEECTSACNALSSMRRSVDRLCQLESGQKCLDARSKLDASEKKVKERCPGCATQLTTPDQPTTPKLEPKEENKPKPAPPPPDAAPGQTGSEERVMTAQSAPTAERPQGGCLGCSTTSSSTGDASVLGLAMVWMVVRLRRRR